ncbi:hypothetical protein P3W85_19590 [Cupriavidus basilensis]|uniref:Phage protein n=1 Tax=Cupriavidus basilensis TaxID=68895 RepID=A0ABT6AR96_9BURK|nr:hypothetical protein [Cupriavidus basilensis]MDF3835147.1 hypothetical protein [Cupriavidus basilensis]
MYPCQCAECSRATLRPRDSDPEEYAAEVRHSAALGYGRCRLKLLPLRLLPVLSIRECDRFTRAEAAVIAERRRWLANAEDSE